MKRQHLRFGQGFHVVLENARAQAATMVLAAGDREGYAHNSHRGSDQWLFVVEGSGAAIVNRHRYQLRPGVLLLIEKGDTHEIRATTRLTTLNLYVPPAYADDDTPLPAGQPA